MNNRMWNCQNPYQGHTKKVLCVCSAGLLRSPTTAQVLNQEYGFNTRAAGIDRDHALIPVDDILLVWADEVVCMTEEQQAELVLRLENLGIPKPVKNLRINDSFAYMDEGLVKLIKARYEP